MLLRQDRFHIHPILCAKIVQGERKRKELVHFLFPEPQPILSKDSARRAKNRANRAKNEVYFNFPEVQPVLSKKKESCSFSFPEPQPILSHIRNFRKIKNFSKRYYSLRSGTTTSSTTASGFGCDTSFFGLSRWSGNVYATDKLTFK